MRRLGDEKGPSFNVWQEDLDAIVAKYDVLLSTVMKDLHKHRVDAPTYAEAVTNA